LLSKQKARICDASFLGATNDKAKLPAAYCSGNYLLLKTWMVVQMAKPTTSTTVTTDANVPMKDIQFLLRLNAEFGYPK
jgi:hypothetical protein